MHKNIPSLYIFLDQYNSSVFKNNITNLGIIYRNYNNTKNEIELSKIAKACKRKRYQLFVSNDIKLVTKYKANGIYIPSFNKSRKFLNLENKNIVMLGSAHNQIQIQNKILQKCAAIFLAPAFKVNKSKNFLGLYKFNLLSRKNRVKIFALGGINEKNLKKLQLFTIQGFGSISLLQKKTGLKKGRFFKEKIF
jgi:thiamine monophosphate synthase